MKFYLTSSLFNQNRHRVFCDLVTQFYAYVILHFTEVAAVMDTSCGLLLLLFLNMTIIECQ